MKKKVLIVLFSVFATGICVQAQAQKVNVVSVSQERDINNFYSMMKEAFPLAFKDPAAPRFIFFDDNKNFIFGVGGCVQMNAVYDFNGLPDYNLFVTSQIKPNGIQPGASYGITLGQSKLFFKLVGNTNVGKLVSYIEMQFEGPDNTPKLQQAFVQFKGFTLGKAWSTFGDMTSVPTTIDQEGPGSAIEIRQPMIRYTCQFTDNMQGSLALEYAEANYTTGDFTRTIRQKVPDIPLNIRYTMKNGGHLQAGFVLRNMSYQNAVNDKDKIQTGWGVMGSGTVHLNTNNSVMFQGVYGKGIANYIQDISSLGYDLIPKVDANGKLKAPSMWGIFGAIQHNWNPKLYSSFIYSYTRMENRGNLAKTSYKYTQYAGANLLWNFTEFGTTGIEYEYGRRNNFDKHYGNGNRINAMIQYRF
ncbi:MAG: DcaP family trimeric outer membrane transporter [Odoribacter sp.]